MKEYIPLTLVKFVAIAGDLGANKHSVQDILLYRFVSFNNKINQEAFFDLITKEYPYEKFVKGIMNDKYIIQLAGRN